MGRDALRERLSGLATAAGLPVPPVEEGSARKPDAPVEVRSSLGEERLVVAPSLYQADAAEQTWHLAAGLGWWVSPVPRRRRIQGLATAALVVAAQLGLGLAELVDAIDLSREGLLAALISSGAALHPLQQAMARREQRALDRAGHAVMAASGYDPATLARQVFGDRRNPPWFRQVLSAEPAPGRRIADADRWPSRRDSLR